MRSNLDVGLKDKPSGTDSSFVQATSRTAKQKHTRREAGPQSQGTPVVSPVTLTGTP
jgi:hypothetical protein